MSLDGSGASRAGGDGYHNEDRFLVKQGLGLYLVCDGMSQSPAGEIAAQIAAESLEEFIAQVGKNLDLESESTARELVELAMNQALGAVADAERRDSDLSGLSTTVTMLLAHRNIGVMGHRGDSRAYLIRRNQSHQLTVDLELTEDAQGQGKELADFDVFTLRLRPGDTIVLCTDGAESVVEDRAFIKRIGELPPRLMSSRIVSEAHQRDPNVDATAVVVRVRGESEPGWLEFSVLPQGSAFGRTLELA